ncbi:MAG: major capsid protein [Microvirus sp.]|nr:MAG: major capsid protein [Microvirus sp.]
MIRHDSPGSEAGTQMHSFSQVPAASIERSAMDRSSSLDTTFDGGLLIPVLCDDILPGDTINLNIEKLIRLNTPILPLMHNVYVDTHVWFVPNRLLWTNWQKFMGEQTNPADSISYVTPKLNSVANIALSSISDYMGLPVGIPVPTAAGVTCFDWRAYNLIWNQWYRDENLQNSVTINTGDGPDAVTDYALLYRGKRKDYFTGALPWAQKGATVTIPLGTSAPVSIRGNDTQPYAHTSGTGDALVTVVSGAIKTGAATGAIRWGNSANAWGDTGLVGTADLSTATAASINLFRQSFAVQHLLERDARGGTRYVELLHSHFGVVSPDARLQRPEFLGGGSSPLLIHPVAQTSVTSGSSPLANLAAVGTSTGGHSVVHSFVEHGVLMVLMSVRAELKYYQGIDRRRTRNTRYDYYWPSFAHLGEQAILNQEIYYQNNGVTADTLTFGYQERYGEYRYGASKLTGLMRPGVAGTLSAYNLAQAFSALPALNDTFVRQSDPWSRVVAVNTEPTFRANIQFNLKHVRPMPLFGTPGLRMM